MRYGDIAELPWGDKERFEPGAFGALGNADIILNFQHDRTRPLARSDGGDLRIDDDPHELRIKAELPDTPDGNAAIELIRKRVLRGFSIEFWPDSYREEDGVIIITKATLRNIAIVDRPAYPKARVNPRSKDSMDETKVLEIIKRALAEQTDKTANMDPVALARSLGEVVNSQVESQVREQIAAALKERDEANAPAAKAENERAADKKKAEEDEEEAKKKAKDDEEDMEKKADDRAELLVAITPLLPEKTETRGKTNHELMVLAVGEEVPEADKRSEDYLMAKIEGIIERRAEAGAPGNPGTTGNPGPAAAKSAPNIIRMVEQRSRTAA